MMVGGAILLSLFFGGVAVHDAARRKEWTGTGISLAVTVAIIVVLLQAK